MGVLKKIQTLPAFALGVFFLYWSLPLAALMGKVKFLKLVGKRNDAYGWYVRNVHSCLYSWTCSSVQLQRWSLCLICRGLALQQLFGVTMLRLPGPGLYRGGGPILFLVSAQPVSAPD